MDNPDASYVEIFSNSCAGQVIPDDFKLVVIVAGSDIIPEEGIDLEGMTIGTDGFLVLCRTATANAVYGGKCDFTDGDGTAVDNDGTKSIAIVLFSQSGQKKKIFDIYGEYCLHFDSFATILVQKYLTF